MPIDPGSLWSASSCSRGGQLERTATTDGNARAFFGAPDELIEGVRILLADRVLELSKGVDGEAALGVLDDLELVLFVAQWKGVDAPGLGADGHVEEAGEHELEAAICVPVTSVRRPVDDAAAARPAPAVIGALDEREGSARFAVALVVDVDDLSVVAEAVEHEGELGLAGAVLTDDEHALAVAGRDDLHASAPLMPPSWSPAAQARAELFQTLEQTLDLEQWLRCGRGARDP